MSRIERAEFWLVRACMILPAAAASVMASMVVVFTLAYPVGGAWWVAVKLSCAALVVGMGLLTVGWLLPARRRRWMDPILLLGAMALLTLGSAGAVHALHMGAWTSDYEYWVVMLDLLLVGQASATIWALWREPGGERYENGRERGSPCSSPPACQAPSR